MGVAIKERLRALDAFRGLTIAGMILVNTPGSWEFVYPPLRHAAWEGCTPTDLVFPFFLYIVGVAMWFSFKKFGHRGDVQIYAKIGKRAALIFLIGLLLNAFPFYDLELSSLRIMGVLQRIAVAFFFGAIICTTISRKWLPLAGAIILLGYWGILSLAGDAAYSLEGNLVLKADMAVLGADHLYGGFGIPFDPEGLLSSLPSIGTVIIGYLVGSYIDRSGMQRPALSTLVAVGVLGIALGMLWGRSFPIIKALWTSSYVLYTAGIATLLLTFFVWLIDLKGVKRWAQPLIVFGLNPLFIYALSGIIIRVMWMIKWTSADGEQALQPFIYHGLASVFGDTGGSLAFAILYVMLHWLIAWWMYQRKIFIKV